MLIGVIKLETVVRTARFGTEGSLDQIDTCLLTGDEVARLGKTLWAVLCGLSGAGIRPFWLW